jgi:Gamma-glutamyl cyclotransferase, AIG2-like
MGEGLAPIHGHILWWSVPPPNVLLFSYGTLQDKAVQTTNFGRELTGHEDALPGYVTQPVRVPDPDLVGSGGESQYTNVVPTSNPGDVVLGMVFEITAQELAAADEYERVAEYHRILATLRSGDQAWVYLRD